MEDLFISSNQLETLENVPDIPNIWADNNKIKTLDSNVYKLNKLSFLFLVGCKINHLPEDIPKINKNIILLLIISGNPLEALPKSIKKLKNVCLQLSHTPFANRLGKIGLSTYFKKKGFSFDSDDWCACSPISPSLPHPFSLSRPR